MADQYPLPEQRIRDFLDALAVFDTGVDLIGEVAAGQYRLTVTDLRDLLAELDASRNPFPHHRRTTEPKETHPMPKIDLESVNR